MGLLDSIWVCTESEQVEKLKEEVARLERLVDKAKRIQQPRGHRGEDLGGPARTRELLSEVTELWDELETPLKERADFLACVAAGGVLPRLVDLQTRASAGRRTWRARSLWGRTTCTRARCRICHGAAACQ